MCENMAKDRYINPYRENIRRSLWDVFLWRAGFYDDTHTLELAPQDFAYPMPKTPIDTGKPRAVWLNHSSFLVQFGGKTLLTDPIWSNRCSPLPFLGPKRRHLPPLEIEQLPKIDYVLISHNHYDHLDYKSIKKLFKLYPHILWFVPTGVKKWFLHQGITNVVESGWWDETILKEGLKVTSVPSQHFSGRRISDLNKTLWTGWVVENLDINKRVYFVGDTGYNPFDFKKIGEQFGFMDLSLIPIGSYLPRRFMSPVHIEPADAVKIHKEVKSVLSLAMHWKTFRLSDEPMHQPPYDLFLALQKEKMDPLTFLAVEPGFEVNW
jgi:N-acyl-phosphatidylethanolamine-hydrolysing phospholipase D